MINVDGSGAAPDESFGELLYSVFSFQGAADPPPPPRTEPAPLPA
jgi:hypothetical protein